MITKRQITVRSQTGELVTMVEEVAGSTYTVTINGVTWEAEDAVKAEWLLDSVEAMMISRAGIY